MNEKRVKLKSRVTTSDSEIKFWKEYMIIMNMLAPRLSKLTDTELDVMVYVLSQDPYKSQFKGTNRMRMQEFLKFNSGNYISTHKKNLVSKGWLSAEQQRGEAIVTGRLRALQIKIKEELETNRELSLEFPFVFKIANND